MNMDQIPQRRRPTGVSILSVLFIIGGVLSIIGIFSGIQGILSFVFGIAYIIIGWGMWKGKRWSWSWFIILTIVGVAMSVISIGFIITSGGFQRLTGNDMHNLILGFSIVISIEIGISLLLIYYFYRPHVKLFFGKY
jgi:hypothetical protein